MNTEIKNCNRGGDENEVYTPPCAELIPISVEASFADSGVNRYDGAENEDLIIEDFFA